MSLVFTRTVLVTIISIFYFSTSYAVTGIPEDIPEELLEEAASSYIFVFEDSVKPGQIRNQARQMTRQAGGQLRHVFSKAIKGFSASVSAHAAAQIAASPQVAYYEPNSIYWAADRNRFRDDDDDDFRATGPGRGPGRDDDDDDDDDGDPAQITPWGIIRVGGPIADSTGLHAWIIDSGIDLDHPDLNVGGGKNFVTLSNLVSPDDDTGHGTHVAGIVAAIDNTIDVVGVAPNATVHPVKVLYSGFGLTDWIVAGIDYVAANALPGDCANMSIGGLGHKDSMHDAIVNAASLGIRFSISAGNDGADAADYEPAHIDGKNIFTISAIDSRDVFAVFSNYGNPPIDFAAPGVGIVSTRLGGGVTSGHGTSMAAPHVCGILLHRAVPKVDGFAINDPDGDPDPIAHH